MSLYRFLGKPFFSKNLKNGTARTYDRIGNLLTDGTWTYTWQNGRELAAMTDGDTTWSYVYDANGMRTSRTNGTTTYNYVYNGSQLVQMTVGNDTLYFTYGLLGPTTVTWNGTTYYYALNIQGDVVGIFNEDGNPVVTYAWDNAWGYNPIPEGVMASTLGELNPLRYRSYVYDTETGYYYLQSRYYDPEIGRFINADTLVSTGQGILGNNMFAYCRNNPVKRKDASGTDDVCVANADDMDTPLNDLGYTPSGGGYANAYNSIDAGYHYGVDFSMASNSSLLTGGIYTNGYVSYGYYTNPCSSSIQAQSQMSVTSQLQNCANIANARVMGKGAVAGTHKHVIFAQEVNNLGNIALRTEVSYLGGMEVPYGTKGSIRFDVLQYDLYGNLISAWDFKSGSATLTSSRIAHMQTASGLNIPISVIK